jgi:hypothetical protein
MQTEENPLEKNDLVEGMKKLRKGVSTGEFIGVRTVTLLAILVGFLAVWLYLRGSNRRSDAETWNALNSLSGSEAFEKYADTPGSPSLTRIARLQQARFLIAQDGIPNLTSFNPESRKKGIESIEKGRELFAKLATEFTDDVTLKGQCLEGLAKAELALIGIPKADKTDEYRGDALKAAKHYTEYAGLVGEKTPAGEALLKKAKEFEEKASELNTVGIALNTKYTPTKPKLEEPKLPDGLTPITPPKSNDPLAPPAVPGVPPAGAAVASPAVVPPAVIPPAVIPPASPEAPKSK